MIWHNIYSTQDRISARSTSDKTYLVELDELCLLTGLDDGYFLYISSNGWHVAFTDLYKTRYSS